MTSREFWEAKHTKYRREQWISRPTYFAEEQGPRFPPAARVLDAGCGQGQDSLYFARLGHTVTAMDFAEGALDTFAADAGALGIAQVSHSLADLPHPFPDAAFDVVYAHLSVHYFDSRTTRAILSEFHRVLRPGGLLCLMVNSVDDPERGEGVRLDDDFYELSPGDRKRYYSGDTLREAIDGLFTAELVEQHGRTRKDPHTAFVRLAARRA